MGGAPIDCSSSKAVLSLARVSEAAAASAGAVAMIACAKARAVGMMTAFSTSMSIAGVICDHVNANATVSGETGSSEAIRLW